MKLKLSALRKQHGLTQADLGAKLGVNKITVGNWENNRNQPSVDDVKKILKLFDIKFEDLDI